MGDTAVVTTLSTILLTGLGLPSGRAQYAAEQAITELNNAKTEQQMEQALETVQQVYDEVRNEISNVDPAMRAAQEAAAIQDDVSTAQQAAVNDAMNADDILMRAAQEVVLGKPQEAVQAAPQRMDAQAKEHTNNIPVDASAEVATGKNAAQGVHTASYNKTDDNITSESFAVTGISSAGNGVVYVTKDNGQTAALDDITFDDPDVDKLYGLASKFDTDAAKKFVSSYDGSVPVGEYYMGFASIYGAPRKGKSPKSAVKNSPYAKALSSAVQQAAYSAGQKPAPKVKKQTIESAQQSVKQNSEEEYDPGIDTEITAQQITNSELPEKPTAVSEQVEPTMEAQMEVPKAKQKTEPKQNDRVFRKYTLETTEADEAHINATAQLITSIPGRTVYFVNHIDPRHWIAKW